MSQPLIAAMQNPAIYPHPVEILQVIETHISWVILTGLFAYKLKKPINLGFLDFTQLEDRGHFCREELRLNQRFTQNLYLEVLPITGAAEAPQLNGTGPVIEYTLKMRQFPQNKLLSTLQAKGELTSAHIDKMAKQIAHFHLTAPTVPQEDPAGTPDKVITLVRQNFQQILPFLNKKDDLAKFLALQAWTENSFECLKLLLAKRKMDGFTRECHGDIHLGNTTLIAEQVVIFDCIEFNELLRLTDINADISFLAMDLENHGLKSLANRFISQYLELTSDYQGLEVLNFYKTYRALVRGKVALLSMPDTASPIQRVATMRQYRHYANLAESYISIPSRFLAITHGVSAAGKSHLAMRLVESLGAICLRSDVERKRIFSEQKTENKQGSYIYTADASAATYTRLNEIANIVLHAGYPVVLDATFLKSKQRIAAAKVAEAIGAPFLILDCYASLAVITSRLTQRQTDKNDPSEATLTVIQEQQANRDPLTPAELLLSKRVETNDNGTLDALVTYIHQQLLGL
ncbi:bifunctional aminoglycoside phosphotransferase/ATP-binding protein [Candidatus Pseudomonas adelgestsugas]|uniref:Aminoglycoside phosphotransferase domain-containing protein n=1 Tax=Candidatus Pseudomonas adelgestsugas TaxID=1302376 RepID=A0ABX5R7X0_9PSED|nr:bifunctional aminoglycoside phosphotransferase/ATP-binding protein [Candidatus Pseudomonas adelgestsugas]QAX81737.1 hypothetical protein C3B55_00385 [Candidatus Pseudomonas adelgestsugas]